MAVEFKDTMDSFFKQAAQMWQFPWTAGARMSDEWARCWNLPPAGDGSLDDCRRRCERFTTDVIGLLQKSAAEHQAAFDAQCRNGLELTRRTFETAAARDLTEWRDRSFELWNTAMDTCRKSTEIGMSTGMQFVENWAGLMTRAADTGATK